MKVLIVLTFDVPDPEAVPAILTAIDPPNLPYFTGEARVTTDPWASAVEKFLDG